MSERLYVYTWKNYPERAKYYGCTCRILKRLRLNSAIVEFINGDRLTVSRNALRKAKS